MQHHIVSVALAVVVVASTACQTTAQTAVPGRLELEVGSPEVDGRVYPPHSARNRVYPPGATTAATSWTNDLVLADSAGRQVMRWVTLGTQPNGTTWELRQTYDARTLAPMAYWFRASNGAEKVLHIDGTRVRGYTRAPTDTTRRAVDWTLPRLGFMVNASDLVPPAVGLRAGAVMSVPVWGVDSVPPVQHEFRVIREETVNVEGVDVVAWRVEEWKEASNELHATWWLIDRSPFMVLAEIPTPNGIQRITGVSLD